jgi:hypothetical protein
MSREPPTISFIDRQYVGGALVVELIAFEPVRALKLLPFSLNHVDFVTQSKVRQYLRLIKVPIGPSDHMNHALTPANVPAGEQKHVC